MVSPPSFFCCIDAACAHANIEHCEQKLCMVIKNVAVQAHREREDDAANRRAIGSSLGAIQDPSLSLPTCTLRSCHAPTQCERLPATAPREPMQGVGGAGLCPHKRARSRCKECWSGGHRSMQMHRQPNLLGDRLRRVRPSSRRPPNSGVANAIDDRGSARDACVPRRAWLQIGHAAGARGSVREREGDASVPTLVRACGWPPVRTHAAHSRYLF